ncbi:YbaK/EbsC family protein [bacterium]|nr:YbaK/EbsC family protein [bacterium]
MAKKQPQKMKIPVKVVKYLEQANVKYEILEHRTVYTAIDAAATMKRKINEIIKTLFIKADKDYYIILLPADTNLDLEKLKKFLSLSQAKKIKTVKIPGEKIVENLLKAKAGAVASFGAIYKVRVVVDKRLEKIKKAVFATGSHNYSVEMTVKNFIKLEEPLIGNFGIKKKIKKQKTAKPKKAKKKKPIKKRVKKCIK